MLKWYQWYVIGRFCNLFCLLHCRNWKSMALMSVCNCVISVKKCFLSPNNVFLRFCQGKTQVPIKNYILNSTNRITTVLCQKCLAQQAHIIRASTLHPSSTILLLSYIFLCEQKNWWRIIYCAIIILYIIILNVIKDVIIIIIMEIVKKELSEIIIWQYIMKFFAYNEFLFSK